MALITADGRRADDKKVPAEKRPIRDGAKFRGYPGRVLGEIAAKKVFAAFFS